MEAYIRNIVFACPDPRALGSFYADLLGMRIIREDWVVIARDESSFPRLAFGDGPAEYRPPRWPDPEHPQQLHLDLPVSNLEAAEEVALRLGASLWRLWAARAQVDEGRGWLARILALEGTRAPGLARLRAEVMSGLAALRGSGEKVRHDGVDGDSPPCNRDAGLAGRHEHGAQPALAPPSRRRRG